MQHLKFLGFAKNNKAFQILKKKKKREELGTQLNASILRAKKFLSRNKIMQLLNKEKMEKNFLTALPNKFNVFYF